MYRKNNVTNIFDAGAGEIPWQLKILIENNIIKNKYIYDYSQKMYFPVK